MSQKTILCTRKEAATILGLEPQTLAKWAMTGKNLPVVRLGNRTIRYFYNDIEAFIARSTAQCSGGIYGNSSEGGNNE